MVFSIKRSRTTRRSKVNRIIRFVSAISAPLSTRNAFNFNFIYRTIAKRFNDPQRLRSFVLSAFANRYSTFVYRIRRTAGGVYARARAYLYAYNGWPLAMDMEGAGGRTVSLEGTHATISPSKSEFL